MPHKDDDSNGNRKDLFSANRLAPEIILIILSFLDYNDNPANLASILTLCKSWARLALELIYEQPVLTLKSLPNFVITLGLQDRLPNGQKPFWETNTHLETGRKTLGIEYRSMIKKPCFVVDCTCVVYWLCEHDDGVTGCCCCVESLQFTASVSIVTTFIAIAACSVISLVTHIGRINTNTNNNSNNSRAANSCSTIILIFSATITSQTNILIVSIALQGSRAATQEKATPTPRASRHHARVDCNVFRDYA
ncbi:hypothetical protein BGX24_006557 [Mortierella sp. AD032]|nr:hypothetical protein BGX24_006557 [Mortierella sp. AD032]